MADAESRTGTGRALAHATLTTSWRPWPCDLPHLTAQLRDVGISGVAIAQGVVGTTCGRQIILCQTDGRQADQGIAIPRHASEHPGIEVFSQLEIAPGLGQVAAYLESQKVVGTGSGLDGLGARLGGGQIAGTHLNKQRTKGSGNIQPAAGYIQLRCGFGLWRADG